MAQRSPAQVYALVFGAVLVIAGVLGFFYNASFGTGDDVERDAVLGILDVNGWHNIVHIASGVVGLAVAGSWAAARGYALWFGATYILITVLGFIYGSGDAIFDFIPINTEDNVLHLLIGVSGLAAGMASRQDPRPTTAPSAS